MDEQTKRIHAKNFAEEALVEFGFLTLAENEWLQADGATDDDLEDIFDLIINATVVIPDVDEP